MPTPAANYPIQIIKPDVGGSIGAWGTILNTTLDGIDTLLKTEADALLTKLPLAGGTMTGRLDAKTSTLARLDNAAMINTVTLDLSVAQAFTGTLTGNTTFVFSNIPAGTVTTGIILQLTNAGAFTITWPASVRWPGVGHTQPTLSGSNGVDVLVGITNDNGTTWRFNAAMLNV